VTSALVLALLGAGLGISAPAIAAPEQATPAPGSPAGTEYGDPFQQGRGMGGSHDNGGPVGPGGSGGQGGPGAGTGATGGPGGTLASGSSSQLFGAGIAPAGQAQAGGSSGSSATHGGKRAASRDAGISTRAVSDAVAGRSSGADTQVWLIVLLVLGGAIALTVLLRVVGRRSPPPSAA
jgi:hypothetical protein